MKLTHKSLNKVIGSNIRSYRLKLNWSLEDLAHKLNVSHQQVHKYEQGGTNVSTKVLYKLSHIFSVSPDYFFKDIDLLKKRSDWYEEEEDNDILPLKRTKPLNIMILEPDPKDDLMLRQAIKDSGINTHVTGFYKVEDALDSLRNSPAFLKVPKPDLIFLEINLPKDEGMCFLKTIKRNPQTQHIPMVIITDLIDKKGLIECYTHQAAGFMRKYQPTLGFKEAIKTVLTYWSDLMAIPHMQESDSTPTIACGE